MSENKPTIFQKLNTIFTKDGVQLPKPQQTNRYNIGKQEIIRTQSKEEYEQALKTAKQNKYLANLWSKVDSELLQKALQYENTRVGSYSDFENMEYYPEIAAALDIMMEEATTPNDKGQVINIYSNSKRVKAILEDLFKNRLDIHTTLPMWTRNTCKYGDNFVQLNVDETAGIIGVRQLPNYEIERRENDLYGIMTTNNLNGDEKEKQRTKFHWKGRDIIFNSWQIAHFRLLGDDRKLPYGTSVLEKARRIWKQLIMSEDAMLVYRITRAPERRVYKIFVGNIDDADVGAYVNEIANRFKRTSMIDPSTGQVDLRYNQMGLDQDIFIPVRTEDAPNPIDTLPGAQNLDQIADIEYLQRKLFTALRVPKSFLGFEEATGEGKNLALQDIRFSRTVNRIQQSMIQELNKIAIIHLYLLGFEDELDNFTLTLNNPSTQAEMLKIEHMQAKVTLYKDAVSDAGNGFGVMSMTRGKRDILAWSDDEIKQDILEQRMEKAAASELENTANVIKHTGFFDKVDKIYGDMDAAKKGGAGPDDSGEDGGPSGGGGGFGGGGFGGADADMDFGDDEDDGDATDGEDGGDAGFGEDGGSAVDFGDEGDDVEMDNASNDMDKSFGENIKKFENILTERKHYLNQKQIHKTKRYNDNFTKLLIESISKKKSIYGEKSKMNDKNLKINDNINKMMGEIDDKLSNE